MFIYVKHFVAYLAHTPLISVFVKVLLVVRFPKASSNWYKTKRNNLLGHIIWLDQRLRGCHQEAVSPLLASCTVASFSHRLSPGEGGDGQGSSSSRLPHLPPPVQHPSRKEHVLYPVALAINSGLPLFMGESHRPGGLTAVTILTWLCALLWRSGQ